jgi:putative DNA primase/helicase
MSDVPCDFNDMAAIHGLDSVGERLSTALEEFAANDSPAPPVKSADSEEGLLDANRRYSYQTLIKYFWFVWGTDTVWDGVNRCQIKVANLRKGVGKECFKLWEESPDRYWVKDIVFEPGDSPRPRTVNLYDGIKMKPDPRGGVGCPKILNHIYRLCSFREKEFEWLMKWIAYPLQYPGAKMASSVIMYGSEGPGKSVIWEEILKKIYSEYAVTIGQSQLESQFTGWRSKRTFALAEEVVSRSEKNHYKGALKQLVTGATHMINEKMLPEREETNHMNFVFLSNSTVPLELDMGDRRYLVLYVDQVPEEGYFGAIFDEIRNSGIECFYQHLLKLELSGFTPHAKPPINEEKNELIDASLPSPVYFHKLWKAGELDVPYRSAVAGDIYRVFLSWCVKNGEFKRKSRDFGLELKRVMTKDRKNIKYPERLSSFVTKRIYVTEEDLEFENTDEYIDRLAESCRAFLSTARSLPDDER